MYAIACNCVSTYRSIFLPLKKNAMRRHVLAHVVVAYMWFLYQLRTAFAERRFDVALSKLA